MCTAMTHRGTPCGHVAIAGSIVCRYHGGGTPLAKSKIKARLLAMSDEALDALHEAIAKGDWPVVVRTAFGILDRSGFGPSSTVKIDNTEADLKQLTDVELEARTQQVLRLIAARKVKTTNDDTPTNANETAPPSDVVH